jgi:hypothetical protein
MPGACLSNATGWTGSPVRETLQQRHSSTITMRRVLAFVLLVALGGLIGAAAVLPAWAVDAPTCRDLERRFEMIKANAAPAQLSLALFPAADGGCVSLARRWP